MNKHQSIDAPELKGEGSVFKSNRSQAVRIPKALAFPDDVKKVEIIAKDGGLFIKPVSKIGSWAEYFARPSRLSADFPDDIEDSPPDDVESF